MNRDGPPASPDRRRFVLAVGAVAVGSVAGCSGVRAPSSDDGNGGAASPTPSGPKRVTVEGTEWSLDPAEIVVRRGRPLEVTYANVGTVAHNLAFGDFDVKTETIQAGNTDTVSFTPDRTGEFPYWCDVSGHREAGMEGTLTVE